MAEVIGDAETLSVGGVAPGGSASSATHGRLRRKTEVERLLGDQTVEVIVLVTHFGQSDISIRAGDIVGLSELPQDCKIIVGIEVKGGLVTHRIFDAGEAIKPIENHFLKIELGTEPLDFAVKVVIELVCWRNAGARSGDTSVGQTAFIVLKTDYGIRIITVDGFAGAEEDNIVVAVVFHFGATKDEM